jgi:hypothetical protein
MNWNSYYMQKRAKEERQTIIKDSPLSKVNWDAEQRADITRENRRARMAQERGRNDCARYAWNQPTQLPKTKQ